MTKHLDTLLELYQKYEIEVTTNTNLSFSSAEYTGAFDPGDKASSNLL